MSTFIDMAGISEEILQEAKRDVELAYRLAAAKKAIPPEHPEWEALDLAEGRMAAEGFAYSGVCLHDGLDVEFSNGEEYWWRELGFYEGGGWALRLKARAGEVFLDNFD